MKANELRIGNKVLNDRCENTIFGIFERMATLKTKQGNEINAQVELLKPLELTEYWLLKLGFKKIKSSYEEAETYDFFKGIIYLDMANTSIKINGVYALSFIPEYVHELQNLYFAITGDELI